MIMRGRLINVKMLLRVLHALPCCETGNGGRHDNGWMPRSASSVKICPEMKKKNMEVIRANGVKSKALVCAA